jgi:hypothetical protein
LGLLSPPLPTFNGICKVRTFIKSEYEMPKFSILRVVIEVRNRENTCSSSGGAQEKGKTG